MSTHNITVDLSHIFAITSADIESALDRTMHDLANEAGKRWFAAIYGSSLDDRTKLEYAKTLHVDRTGRMSFRVTADYAKAQQLEVGIPERDLKRMLQTSTKTRQGKNGKYLIIPMRTNTPGHVAHARDMPKHLYSRMTRKDSAGKDLFAVSRVLRSGSRVSATGHVVNKSEYDWGARLPAGLAPKLAPHHKTDPFAGMVRMDTSTGKARSSAFLTFRVMSEKSNGWLIPAKPGLHIMRDLAAELETMAPAFVKSRIEELLG